MLAYDYIVIGSGGAGLTFAIDVARNATVLVATKKESSDSNTNWAQGGIAGVLGADDTTDLHFEDTVIAGAGLCDEAAVRILVEEGPLRIQDLMDMGAHFNREDSGDLSLGREGGHSRRRIVRAADLTGWEVERALLEAARIQTNIEITEHHAAIDLIVTEGVCRGIWVLNELTGEIEPILARATLLATGGCGQVYQHTTNPDIATGDGVAMAWRAGCEIANMEFIQFHPTSLYHPDAKCYLISEAVRGEGAVLRTADGAAFMEKYDPRKDLAPRDIVARAIDCEMKRAGAPCVYLDITHVKADEIRERFPNIYARCLGFGIDITTDWIPVVPAAHYACGGVRTDLVGRTNIAHLYACGEVACTGVHGANRLASNSLLEALVFGKRAAQDAARITPSAPTTPSSPDLRAPGSQVQATEIKRRVRTAMQHYVGIVRSDRRLQKAHDAIASLWSEAQDWTPLARPNTEALETRNLMYIAESIVSCAQKRRESRGLHYTIDYPNTLEAERHDTILVPPAPGKGPS